MDVIRGQKFQLFWILASGYEPFIRYDLGFVVGEKGKRTVI